MLDLTASRATLRRGFVSLGAWALLAAGPLAWGDEIQEAQKLLRAGQHQQALERVNRSLAAKPRDPQARFLKGVILTEQGNTKEAVEIFSRLTQDFPDLPEPYNNLAVIYASQGQYERARAALEQSIRTHPSYATAYENLGDLYAKLASQAYDKALQLDKTNKAAQKKLSLVREIGRGPAPVAVAAKPVSETTKPIAEAPKPEARTPVAEKPAAPSDASGEVLKTVNAWAQAWSNRDVDAYLAHYAKDFKTPGGEPRPAWEKGRRSRIAGAKTISVVVSEPKVILDGDKRATVSFRQAYRSDTFRATGTKTLVLVRSADGRWQIQEEKAG
ncbi:MAG TPA: tetratricopeptide repeat protein [Burkholderiales bacterium]|nr:tetratricopeptide repeat protein [Burkholderiales bacterium]